jgi:AraC-like DNA-binding protein
MLDMDQGTARRPRQSPDRVLEPTVRIGPLAAIPAVLRDLGVDPAAALRETGFDPSYFDDHDLPVSYRSLGRALAQSASAAGCEHFGLLVGARSGPGSVGVVGHLMTLAPDVGTALGELQHYFGLHDRGGSVVLELGGDLCALGYAVVTPGVEGIDQVHDLSLAVGCNLMRALCGPAWAPASVHLPRRRPRDAEPWRRFFGAPVAFDAPRSLMRFPRRWLAAPVPTADRSLHGFVRRHADAARAEAEVDPVAEVRALVRACIAEGGGHAAQVARLLGVHPRTLNRRLATAGTTFQQVRDGALHAMSLQLLGATSMPVSEAAAALGYADATAFIRAFRRWTGVTPACWRRGHGWAATPSQPQAPT